MEKFSKALFSMRMMALAMLVFLLAIGAATMIESIYDIQTAKIMIYNAFWFECLLIYLTINLIANIFRYRMFRREKIATLTFHLSFIIIIIGAGITRFFSFEGMMIITEGQSSNIILAADPHLWFRIDDNNKMQASHSEKMFMSEQTNNYFSLEKEIPSRKSTVTIEYVDFKKKQVDSLLISDTIKTGVLDIVTGGMNSTFVGPSGFVMVGDVALSYDKKDAMPGISIKRNKGQLMIETKVPVRYLPMSQMKAFRQSGQTPPDSLYTEIPTDSMVPFLSTTLYQVNGEQFVFKREIPHAKMVKMSSGKKKVGIDILTLKITDGNKSKVVELEGGYGQLPTKHMFTFNGLTYQMQYGSTMFELPFYILCRNFTLDQYPGSDVASSFSSDVTIQDEKNHYTRDQRIFMNNVMDYNGFRFFQSAYDLDDPNTPENEEGTRLSVNQDWLGTNVTYLGYLLMAIGMVLSIFSRNGRFKELQEKIKKSRLRRESALMILLLVSMSFFNNGFAQEAHNHEDHAGHNHANEKQVVPQKPIFRIASEEHSKELASLLVQDFKGRIIPFQTMCNELLSKVYGSKSFNGKNAVQTVMSMHMYPDHWLSEKIISVPSAVREELKLSNYASFKDLIDANGQLKFIDKYNAAHKKLESKRNEFEKKIIKLVERHQVLNSIFSWQYMKLIPLKNDAKNNWYVPLSMDLMQKDSLSSSFALQYLSALDEGSKTNSYGTATDKLNALKKFQRLIGGKFTPSETHVKWEIRYNNMNIFKNSMNSYILVGLVLLIIFFIRIFIKPTPKSEKKFKRISIPFVVLITIIFLYHGAGLGMRWYISGHAPWSNGYEAVIFIAWVTMIAGFIFSKKNPVVLAGTAILAFFMIFVSEMSLLDPEITPLQPVLKSYWLMIHVAIITGSYGFLGLGAILGFFNQILYVFRNKINGKRISAHISEITYISELTMTIGLFMLTIGTFLGGIWANESWGRYWGWDPKETWALVSVLVYAVILHLRYIPQLSNKFTFNLVSFWGYTSILFTFFGVNFYLTGLHSYASDEGLAEVPKWIFWTIFGFYVFTEFAAYRYQIYKSQTGKLPIKHFINKLIISCSILLVVCILQLIFIKQSFDFEVIYTYFELAGWFALIIGLMAVLNTIRKESTVEL